MFWEHPLSKIKTSIMKKMLPTIAEYTNRNPMILFLLGRTVH
jgi:hypothetical protein